MPDPGDPANGKLTEDRTQRDAPVRSMMLAPTHVERPFVEPHDDAFLDNARLAPGPDNAAFQAERTTWLNMTRKDRSRLVEDVQGMPSFASVVAFQGTVVSPPRYFASNDSEATGGTGFASDLLLQFSYDGGQLSRLQWYGSKCSGCNAEQCLGGNTCAQPLDDDSREPVIMAGCVGTDRHSAPFTSGDAALDIR